jgi:hypothetical protein
MANQINGPLSQQASQGRGIVNPSTSIVGGGGFTDTSIRHGQTSSPELASSYRPSNPAQPTRGVPAASPRGFAAVAPAVVPPGKMPNLGK